MQKNGPKGIGDYFGSLVNQAFGGLRQGVGTAMGALDRTKAQPNPSGKLLSPLADSYRPPQRTPQPQGQVMGQSQMARPTTQGPRLEKPQVYNQRLEEYIKSLLGPGDPARKDLTGRYPILGELDYMRQKEQELNRPGLADLLVLQSLFEGAGGRTGNPFGVLPGGEGSGRRARFGNLQEAIDYQLSPNVLGGGVGGKLNILGRGQGPITPEDVEWLYGGGSYDAGQTYTDHLYPAYKQVRGY